MARSGNLLPPAPLGALPRQTPRVCPTAGRSPQPAEPPLPLPQAECLEPETLLQQHKLSPGKMTRSRPFHPPQLGTPAALDYLALTGIIDLVPGWGQEPGRSPKPCSGHAATRGPEQEPPIPAEPTPTQPPAQGKARQGQALLPHSWADVWLQHKNFTRAVMDKTSGYNGSLGNQAFETTKQVSSPSPSFPEPPREVTDWQPHNSPRNPPSLLKKYSHILMGPDLPKSVHLA